MKREVVMLYTDGACSPNPGQGGFGALLCRQGIYSEKNGCVVNTTNNQMEMLAVIVGLQEITEPSHVVITTDSQLICNAFNKSWINSWARRGWKSSTGAKVKNIKLWQLMVSSLKNHTYEFVWVKGHDSNEHNNYCDQLAVSARQSMQNIVCIDKYRD